MDEQIYKIDDKNIIRNKKQLKYNKSKVIFYSGSLSEKFGILNFVIAKSAEFNKCIATLEIRFLNLFNFS